MATGKQTIQCKLTESWNDDPAASSLGFSRDGDAWQWWTREETARRSFAAASLLADRGLKPGDACALVLESDATCAALLLGVLLRNARPVLVAPPIVRGLHGNLAQVLRHVAERTSARLLVTREAFADVAELTAQHVSGLRTWVLPNAHSIPEGGDSEIAPRIPFPDPSDLAAFQLTSGTTGFPRVCAWRQDRVLAAIDGMLEAMHLGEGDRFVNWTPLYHDMGLVNNFLLCLTSGIPLAMLPAQAFVTRPLVWLQALTETRATTTWSPNFGFALATQRIGDAQLEGVDLSGMRGFWNAAERIHLGTMQEFHRRFADCGVTWQALKTNFGCAENVGGATFSDPDGELRAERVDAKALHAQGIARPAEGDQAAVDIVSAGRPHPTLQMAILDDHDQPCADGVVGEVALNTPSRMVEYVGDPEATAGVLSNGLLKTGDLGYQRDGDLFWVGRVRERITLHGKKYDPSDLETTLFEVSALRPGCFAAFGVDDPTIGTQRLVVVSEVRTSDDPEVASLPAVVREAVAKDLGVAVWDVVLLPPGAMSKTSSGKRRHRHYRQLYLDAELQPVACLREHDGLPR